MGEGLGGPEPGAAASPTSDGCGGGEGPGGGSPEHPRWGARKLIPWLARRQPGLRLPAASTAGDILKRTGLVRDRHRRRHLPHPGRPTTEGSYPNQLWSADFKGQFRTRDTLYCYPLTVADSFSRYVLGCRSQLTTATIPTKKNFELVFRNYGLPEAIRTDNGNPFSCVNRTPNFPPIRTIKIPPPRWMFPRVPRGVSPWRGSRGQSPLVGFGAKPQPPSAISKGAPESSFLLLLSGLRAGIAASVELSDRALSVKHGVVFFLVPFCPGVIAGSVRSGSDQAELLRSAFRFAPTARPCASPSTGSCPP